VTTAQIVCLVLSYVFAMASGSVVIDYNEDSTAPIIFWGLIGAMFFSIIGAFI
jgi:hypothetical protein